MNDDFYQKLKLVHPKTFYQPIADVFGAEQHPQQSRFFYRINKIIEFCKDGLIVDAGSNTGFNLFEMARLGYNTIGVEVHPLQFQVCKMLHEYYGLPNIRIYNMRIQDFKLEEDATCTMFLMVMHHMIKEDFITACKTIDRFAKRSKYIIIQMRETQWMIDNNIPPTPYWIFDYTDLKNCKELGDAKQMPFGRPTIAYWT